MIRIDVVHGADVENLGSMHSSLISKRALNMFHCKVTVSKTVAFHTKILKGLEKIIQDNEEETYITSFNY